MQQKSGVLPPSIISFCFLLKIILSDEETGFYGVFAKLFKDLSEEDYHFMDASEEDYPKFGNSETDVDYVVHQFYGFWQSFYTKKSYVWEEEWDTREAPNRWVRRKMEQENAKKTEQARKERSKEIQALVDWVRRRDPRVKELLKIAFLFIHERYFEI